MTDLNKDGFKIEIDEMEIEADKALLFDHKYIVWGEMKLMSKRRDNSTDLFIEYSNKFLNNFNATEIKEFETFVKDDWPGERDNPDSVLGGTHPTFLYVVEDIEVEFDLINMEEGRFSSIEEYRKRIK